MDELSITSMDEAYRFMREGFEAVGTSRKNAEIISNNLLQADYRGHFSHGMNRLETYIKAIKAGECNSNAEPTIEKETVATALVNGNNGLGSVIGTFCMNLAIEKARNAGIGMVTAYGSNHFGIAGIYTIQAVEQGFLGLSFTNTSPIMAPTRAKEAALGSNPISLAAPALNGDSFVLDMATTTVALGKIEMCHRKGQPVPEGWVLNNDNQVKLLPLGGTELTSGYKGYGLGMLVEVLCGILSGSNYGPNIPMWGIDHDIANLGQAFIAIDPQAFAPGFENRMNDLMQYLRNMEPITETMRVQVPGDPERNHMEKVQKDGGIRYVKDQHKSNDELAIELNVKPMETIIVGCKVKNNW